MKNYANSVVLSQTFDLEKRDLNEEIRRTAQSDYTNVGPGFV